MESRALAPGFALSALLAAVLGAGISGACTQDVVVVMGAGGDGGGEGSAIVGVGVGGQQTASGQGGEVTQVTVAVSSGMGECSTPAPVGAITDGTTGIASSSGGGVQCQQLTEDDAQNQWIATCGPSGCACLYNDAPICTCTFVAPAQGCDTIEGNGCCPFPWGDP